MIYPDGLKILRHASSPFPALLLLFFSTFATAQNAPVVKSQCPPRDTCHVANPKVFNVFWASSIASWNASLSAGSIPEATTIGLDDLVRGLVESEYFDGLAQYGVNRLRFRESFATPQCASPPGTANLDDMKQLVARTVSLPQKKTVTPHFAALGALSCSSCFAPKGA